MRGKPLCALLALLFCAKAMASSFIIVGASQQLYPTGISADGHTLIGMGLVPPLGTSRLGMTWTASAGLNFMPSAGSVYESIPTGVSNGGTVIAGYNQALDNSRTAWVWTAANGYQPIAAPPAGASIAVTDISANGQTVVGEYNTGSSSTPFIWTSAGGAITLPVSAGSSPLISADGSTITGEGAPGGYIWTSAGGVRSVNMLPNTYNFSPEVISQNGSTILGQATDYQNNWFMFKYSGGVMSTIPSPAFSSVTYLTGLDGASADLSKMVGNWLGQDATTHDRVTTPWFWSQATGYETIQSYLAASGASPSTYQIQGVSGISADGSLLYGNGLTSDGQPSTWVALVPEPSTLFIGVVGLAGIRRRDRQLA
jgi:hypothetical protein